MVSQDKLIKEGIRYTDALFDEISKRLEKGILTSDTLESFLNKTKDYTSSNPLVVSGYDATMLKLILSETNNHKFSRPSQKEMVRVTIENKVGEKIQDVGEDIKDSVRDIVKEGYNNNLSQDEIAANISDRVSVIKNTRARAIARTEIARTATISDYIITKGRGATGWYVECRNTACPVCKNAWHKKWTEANDDSFNPSDTSAGGKGWIGDRIFSMDDTAMLPPVHPNCRCVVYYVTDKTVGVSKTKPRNTTTTTTATTASNTPREPTKEDLSNNLTPSERAKYANYKRLVTSHTKWLNDNPDASDKAIANHKAKLAKAQQNLNALVSKALGSGGSKSVSKPKTTTVTTKPKSTSKPKGTVKPKANLKPKAKDKPKKDTNSKTNSKKRKEYKTESEVPNPTNEQIKQNLDSVEIRQYKRKINEIKDLRKRLKSNPNDPTTLHMLDYNLNILDSLKRKALGLDEKTGKKKTSNSSKSKTNIKLEAPFDKSKHLTKDQLDKMDFKELAEHHGVTYKGVEVYNYDNKKYHVIEQTFEDGRKFTLRFEEGAVKSYTKKGIATPNEIIHEVFKVPEALRIETKEIWFKNTQQGIRVSASKTGYDTFGQTEGGYNTYKLSPDEDGDYNHRIVINPKHFKGGGKGRFVGTWIKDPEDARNWKHTIFHEFVHSGDLPRGSKNSYSGDKEYTQIEKEERGFTWYANKQIFESFAEHGGYIAYMESNPSEQKKRMQIQLINSKGKVAQTSVNYEEYKKMYPKHYKYFMKKFKDGF